MNINKITIILLYIQIYLVSICILKSKEKEKCKLFKNKYANLFSVI